MLDIRHKGHTWILHSHNIVSFLSKILGRNQDFPKGSVWEGKSLFKVPGRKGFREEFEFLPVRKFDVDDLQRL